MTSEVFIPCYCGSFVTTGASALQSRIYACAWTEQPEAFKRAMRIVVERTLRPIEISIGGLFQLNLPIFLRVSGSLEFVIAPP